MTKGKVEMGYDWTTDKKYLESYIDSHYSKKELLGHKIFRIVKRLTTIALFIGLLVAIGTVMFMMLIAAMR